MEEIRLPPPPAAAGAAVAREGSSRRHIELTCSEQFTSSLDARLSVERADRELDTR